MLSYILGLAQNFERRHGFKPRIIYLSNKHLHVLQNECPGLKRGELLSKLGFRVVLLDACELAHPTVAWIPPYEPRHIVTLPSVGEDGLKQVA